MTIVINTIYSTAKMIFLWLWLCVMFTEKQEKEVDIYASLSDEKAFVFSVALAEINRKILGQRLIL